MSDDKKQYKVVRLANAPAGDPYKIQTRRFDAYADVDQQVGMWWSSRGTLAIVVMDGDKEDSRYERDWIDRTRVPDGWEDRKGSTAADVLAKLAEARVESAPDVPITIFNEEDEVKKKKPTRRTGNYCYECLRPLPDEAYPGDDEKNPSGRHNARRCGTCGHPEPGMTRRNLFQRHVHRAATRPQSPTAKPQYFGSKTR